MISKEMYSFRVFFSFVSVLQLETGTGKDIQTEAHAALLYLFKS